MDDDDGLLADLGFMFDAHHSRVTKSIIVDNISLDFKCIDEEPGHVQSGQHLWPGALQLSKYLISISKDNLSSDNISNFGVVLELGAGCGLCGLVSMKLLEAVDSCSNIYLTDYDPGSLKLLQENIELNCRPQSKVTMNVLDVKWGCVSLLSDVCAECAVLIIGSDLIYCTGVVKPLLTTVASILHRNPLNVFLLSCSFDIGIESLMEMENCMIELKLTKAVVQISQDPLATGSKDNIWRFQRI